MTIFFIIVAHLCYNTVQLKLSDSGAFFVSYLLVALFVDSAFSVANVFDVGLAYLKCKLAVTPGDMREAIAPFAFSYTLAYGVYLVQLAVVFTFGLLIPVLFPLGLGVAFFTLIITKFLSCSRSAVL